MPADFSSAIGEFRRDLQSDEIWSANEAAARKLIASTPRETVSEVLRQFLAESSVMLERSDAAKAARVRQLITGASRNSTPEELHTLDALSDDEAFVATPGAANFVDSVYDFVRAFKEAPDEVFSKFAAESFCGAVMARWVEIHAQLHPVRWATDVAMVRRMEVATKVGRQDQEALRTITAHYQLRRSDPWLVAQYRGLWLDVASRLESSVLRDKVEQ